MDRMSARLPLARPATHKAAHSMWFKKLLMWSQFDPITNDVGNIWSCGGKSRAMPHWSHLAPNKQSCFLAVCRPVKMTGLYPSSPRVSPEWLQVSEPTLHPRPPASHPGPAWVRACVSQVPGRVSGLTKQPALDVPGLQPPRALLPRSPQLCPAHTLPTPLASWPPPCGQDSTREKSTLQGSAPPTHALCHPVVSSIRAHVR